MGRRTLGKLLPTPGISVSSPSRITTSITIYLAIFFTMYGALLGLSCPLGAQMANFDRNAIVLDPAHGGSDAGGLIESKFGDRIQEKQVTLAFGRRLRSELVARQFTVVMTRIGDLGGGDPDQRAELANHSHAVACVVLHASASVNGIVLGMSALGTSLAPIGRAPRNKSQTGVPWNRAQEAYIGESSRLANQVGAALIRSDFPATVMRLAMRPLDNMSCPTLSVELGNVIGEATVPVSAADDAYQQHVAEILADALALWSTDAQLPGFQQVSAGGTH